MSAVAHEALLLGIITILFYRFGKDSGDRFYVGISCFWGGMFLIDAITAVMDLMQ